MTPLKLPEAACCFKEEKHTLECASSHLDQAKQKHDALSRNANPEEKQRLKQELLDELNWHGVAMVEFKVTEDGTPYLMEINTRFWGSLQLAIDAGVDFPYNYSRS